jgi:hypothetical protein
MDVVVREDPNASPDQIDRAKSSSQFLAQRIIRALAIATIEHETADAG